MASTWEVSFEGTSLLDHLLAELSFPEGCHLFRKKQSPSPRLAWVLCTALFLSHFALHFNCLIAY